jgi:hypothetical protein
VPENPFQDLRTLSLLAGSDDSQLGFVFSKCSHRLLAYLSEFQPLASGTAIVSLSAPTLYRSRVALFPLSTKSTLLSLLSTLVQLVTLSNSFSLPSLALSTSVVHHADLFETICKIIGDELEDGAGTHELIHHIRSTATPDEQPPGFFSRLKLKQLPIRDLWLALEWKQLDAHQKQNAFGVPYPAPPGATILRFQLRSAQTYISYRSLVVMGADCTNSYANVPSPIQPTFVSIDDACSVWYRSRHGKEVDRLSGLPVLNALQGNPEAGALREKQINKILDDYIVYTAHTSEVSTWVRSAERSSFCAVKSTTLSDDSTDLHDFPNFSILLELVGCVDASNTTDLRSRRSVTGLAFCLTGGAIAFKSKLEPTVSRWLAYPFASQAVPSRSSRSFNQLLQPIA